MFNFGCTLTVIDFNALVDLHVLTACIAPFPGTYMHALCRRIEKGKIPRVGGREEEEENLRTWHLVV